MVESIMKLHKCGDCPIMKLHKCADCPIRRRASRKPGSLSARIHRWHATWWPGWKMYRAELGDLRAKAMPRA